MTNVGSHIDSLPSIYVHSVKGRRDQEVIAPSIRACLDKL
jgi:hypothetical protein